MRARPQAEGIRAEVPLAWARLMGEYVVLFPWFGAFYIGVAFVALPVALYLCSLLLNYGVPGLLANMVLNVLVVGGTLAFMKNFVQVYSKVTGKEVAAVPDGSEIAVGKKDVESQ